MSTFVIHEPCKRCGHLTAYEPAEHFYEAAICGSCREQERQPQGEPMRLFAPASNQIPGQMNL